MTPGQPAVKLGPLLDPVVGAGVRFGVLLVSPNSLQAAPNLDARAEAVGSSVDSFPRDATIVSTNVLACLLLKHLTTHYFYTTK